MLALAFTSPLDRFSLDEAHIILRPWKNFRDILILAKYLKEMGYFCENSKYFRDIVIQSFLKLGEF